MTQKTLIYLSLIFIITYWGAVIINYKWIRRYYSKDGISYDGKPTLIDFLLCFFPMLNLILFIFTSFLSPYRTDIRSLKRKARKEKMQSFLNKTFKPNCVKDDSKNNKDEKEFTFIWYKKMEVNNTAYYTQPFRTKIKALNKEEASKKLSNFALGKMTLQIIEEKDFDSTDIMKLQKEFERINNLFSNSIDNLFKNKI